MASDDSVSYVSCEELIHRINTEQDNYIVIDVRDLDRSHGYIPGSRSYPECNFEEHVSNLAQELHSIPKDIIFHCMFSQVRGPRCAYKFADQLLEYDAKCRVRILTGGFRNWVTKVSVLPNSSRYIENFDRKSFNFE